MANEFIVIDNQGLSYYLCRCQFLWIWLMLHINTLQSWPIVKIAINSNSSERPLSNSNTNSNSLEVSLAIAIPIAIVPKMVNSNSKSIAIVQFLLLKGALKEIFISEMHLHSIWNAFGTKKCILRLEKQHFRPALWNNSFYWNVNSLKRLLSIAIAITIVGKSPYQ